MKKCRNCSTLVENGLQKCPTCSMTNNFEIVELESIPTTSSIKDIYKRCKNCGTHNSDLTVENCVSCNFPLKQAEIQSSNRKTKVS